MGRYYAEAQGEDKSVAAAIEDHYKPVGPSDRLPSGPVSITVALAEKLDLLSSFWAIVEEPTGSRDPYALRRAALGVVEASSLNWALECGWLRVIREHLARIFTFEVSVEPAGNALRASAKVGDAEFAFRVQKCISTRSQMRQRVNCFESFRNPHIDAVSRRLLAYFAERLKGQLREQGAPARSCGRSVRARRSGRSRVWWCAASRRSAVFLQTDDGRKFTSWIQTCGEHSGNRRAKR